ncbi:hypothetical protein KKB40_01115 [Patescibacteria group bacterium]|nr:hypothetical protein [Patescibacteria group bacterium]
MKEQYKEFKEENFGCKMHHRVFFSKRETQEHIKEKCHPENIFKLKGTDSLGRMTYNIISEAIDASGRSEQEREWARQAYLW